MSDTEQIVVSLEARIRDFERNMQRAAQTANREFGSIERRSKEAANRLESSFASAGANIGNKLKSLASVSAGAIGAALSANELRKYADGWTEAGNKLRAAGESVEFTAARQKELAAMAIRSRSDLGATVDLYTGLSRATKEMGATAAQNLRVTETVNKAFAVGGQSAETAAGAIRQLNQALASGVLRGDELNSVLEGAPPLARLIAQEFGVSVGQLKSLGEDGKLTADRVFGAILKGSASIDAEFAKTNSTIAQSFQNLKTALTQYVGELDQATGASSAMARVIGGIADNINLAVPAAATLGAALLGLSVGGPIGAAIAGGFVGVSSALYEVSGAIQPIAGEMATLGDYASVAFSMIRDGAANAGSGMADAFSQASAAMQEGFARAADLVTQALLGIDGGEAMGRLLEAVKITANQIIGAFAVVGSTVSVAWNNLGFAMAEGIIGAVNAAIQAIEKLANGAVAAVNSVTGGINSALGTSIGQVGNINLGRVTNSYAGAGKAAVEAFEKGAKDALSKDYVGDLAAGLGGIGSKLREGANARADDRAEQARRDAAREAERKRRDGALNQKLRNTGAGADDGGGGGSGRGAGKERANDLEREIQRIEKRTRAFDAERQVVGKSAFEAAKAEASFRLLEMAKKSNIPLDDALKQRIEGLATAYAQSKVALDQAEKQFEMLKDIGRQASQGIADAFADAIVNGEKLTDVLAKLAKSIAAMLIKKGVSALLSSALGGVIPGFAEGGQGQGFASGGIVSGPGGPRDDRIPAMLSNGEFVVNALATARHLPLLDALNSGRVARLAAGGVVGGASLQAVALSAQPVGQAISISAPITVNGSAGTPAQNDDLAKQIGKQMEQTMRGVVADEMRRQTRPGNMANNRSR